MNTTFRARVATTYRPVFILIMASLLVSIVTRIVLLCLTLSSGLSAQQIIPAFFIGFLYDLLVAGFMGLPLCAFAFIESP
ncbi:MAG: hypothetical protein EOO02_21995, partial [Chitinophagaceae bacterium]